MDILTDKQMSVLNFIKDYTKDHGYQPSSRDMAEHFKMSSAAIQHNLNAIQKKGYIQLTGRSRAIKVLK